jgi:hypothetical protein
MGWVHHRLGLVSRKGCIGSVPGDGKLVDEVEPPRERNSEGGTGEDEWQESNIGVC